MYIYEMFLPVASDGTILQPSTAVLRSLFSKFGLNCLHMDGT